MQPKITISDFHRQLHLHDWYFPFSDDSKAYQAGSDDADRLDALALEGGGRHLWLLQAYASAMYSGSPWGAVKVEPPPAPLTYDLYDLIDLRADFEVDEICHMTALALTKISGTPNPLTSQPHSEICQEVEWLAFYEGVDRDFSIFFKRTPVLKAAWEAGLRKATTTTNQGEAE